MKRSTKGIAIRDRTQHAGVREANAYHTLFYLITKFHVYERIYYEKVRIMKIVLRCTEK